MEEEEEDEEEEQHLSALWGPEPPRGRDWACFALLLIPPHRREIENWQTQTLALRESSSPPDPQDELEFVGFGDFSQSGNEEKIQAEPVPCPGSKDTTWGDIPVSCRVWGHPRVLQGLGTSPCPAGLGDIPVSWKVWGHPRVLQGLGTSPCPGRFGDIPVSCRAWGHPRVLEGLGTSPCPAGLGDIPVSWKVWGHPRVLQGLGTSPCPGRFGTHSLSVAVALVTLLNVPPGVSPNPVCPQTQHHLWDLLETQAPFWGVPGAEGHLQSPTGDSPKPLWGPPAKICVPSPPLCPPNAPGAPPSSSGAFEAPLPPRPHLESTLGKFKQPVGFPPAAFEPLRGQENGARPSGSANPPPRGSQ
ncbi:PREDICTED: leucine-rich repeat extensin-like protein 5 [Ficedula albicollis]|uniref:leucine-rich repeat extensin-like protein 5 n=1 Tax=Ficedula albicollis TaxID=59894 RepID=UPI0007AD7A17|nr:PREDICTED: leucine-rich repeat extensin-like protein 5 [Ficedula albicollis]